MGLILSTPSLIIVNSPQRHHAKLSTSSIDSIPNISASYSPSISIPDTTATNISTGDELSDDDVSIHYNSKYSDDDDASCGNKSIYQSIHPIDQLSRTTHHQLQYSVAPYNHTVVHQAIQTARSTQTDTRLIESMPQLCLSNTSHLLSQLYHIFRHQHTFHSTVYHSLHAMNVTVERTFINSNYNDIIKFTNAPLLHICLCLGNYDIIKLLQSYHTINWYAHAQSIQHITCHNKHSIEYSDIDTIQWCNLLHIDGSDECWKYLPINIQQRTSIQYHLH